MIPPITAVAIGARNDPDWSDRAMAGCFLPGMVLCVESLIAEEGSESIKLETQVLITDTGAERLDSFPFEEV